MKGRIVRILVLLLCSAQLVLAQRGIKWMPDGNAYTRTKDGGIIKVDPKTEAETVLIKKEQLTPAGATKQLALQSYAFSNDNSKLLVFTHTAKVWRFNTRGDYWVFDTGTQKLWKLGKNLTE